MDRTEYLLRVAHDFLMLHPYMQDDTIMFDGAECDGGCLVDDIEIELGLDSGEYALDTTQDYEDGLLP